MTDQDRTKLEAAGWTVIEDGFWKSPLTGNRFPERAAVAVVNIKPRTYSPIYRPRYQRATR